MARALPRTAGALLCFVLLAYSLKCRVCNRKPPLYTCLDEELQTCTTTGVCTMITVKDRGIVMDQTEGCTKVTKHCGKAKKTHSGIFLNITCCKTDLCNFWEFDGDFK